MAADAAASPAAPRSARPATLRNVQALRAVAALLVVFVHLSGSSGFESRYLGGNWTGFLNLSGNGGVDLFFVISGLIMTVTTWRSFDAPRSARRFLWRRATRIYPLYWLITTPILMLYLVSPGSVNSHADAPPNILASYLLLPQAGLPLLLVGWTLVYELYFYLIFAIGMLLGRARFHWLIGGWCAVTLVLHLIVGQTGNPWLGLVSGLLSMEFAFGVLVGYAVVHRRMPGARIVLGVGVLVVVVVFAYLAGRTEFPSEAFRVFGVGLPMAMVVYGAVGIEMQDGVVLPGFLQRWGDASYSLYLIHVPALTAAGMVISKVISPNAVVHLVGVVAVPAGLIVASLLSYRFVEQPLQAFFHRRVPSFIATPSATADAAAPAPPPVPADGAAADVAPWYLAPPGPGAPAAAAPAGFPTAPPVYDGYQAPWPGVPHGDGPAPVPAGYEQSWSNGYQAPGHNGYPVAGHDGFQAPGHNGYPVAGHDGYEAPGRNGYPVAGHDGYAAAGHDGYEAPGRSGYEEPAGPVPAAPEPVAPGPWAFEATAPEATASEPTAPEAADPWRRSPYGGHGADGHGTEDHSTGGYSTGGYSTGGYSTGGYSTGGYATDAQVQSGAVAWPVEPPAAASPYPTGTWTQHPEPWPAGPSTGHRAEDPAAPAAPDPVAADPYRRPGHDGEPMVIDLDATNPFGQSLLPGHPPRRDEGTPPA